MLTQPSRAAADSKRLRVAAGRWLKGLREARSLTQREMAEKVGLRYYTFISQIEGGHGRIPPEQYEAWADVLGLDHKTFASQLMRYYDPVYYKMLFGEEDAVEAEAAESPARRGVQGA